LVSNQKDPLYLTLRKLHLSGIPVRPFGLPAAVGKLTNGLCSVNIATSHESSRSRLNAQVHSVHPVERSDRYIANGEQSGTTHALTLID
jgi:hypothetical protein